ncbi:hypothetical protein TNCV_4753211, partial [Trichonephila clavipes]
MILPPEVASSSSCQPKSEKAKYNAEEKQAHLKGEIEKLKIERDFYRDFCDELLTQTVLKSDRKEWKPAEKQGLQERSFVIISEIKIFFKLSSTCFLK